jgi:ketosteroid isomerase-like protein
MSRENVEVVRRGLEAFDRGELSEALAVMSEDLEWLPPSYVLDGVSYSGHEGYAAWFEGLNNTWSRLDLAWTLSDPGGKQVIGQFRGEFVGRKSGTPIHQRFWIVYWLAGGKITRGEAFPSETEALEAVGLRE